MRFILKSSKSHVFIPCKRDFTHYDREGRFKVGAILDISPRGSIDRSIGWTNG